MVENDKYEANYSVNVLLFIERENALKMLGIF